MKIKGCGASFWGLWGCGGGAEEGVCPGQRVKTKSLILNKSCGGISVRVKVFKGFLVRCE